jgi:hypothetical protein
LCITLKVFDIAKLIEKIHDYAFYLVIWYTNFVLIPVHVRVCTFLILGGGGDLYEQMRREISWCILHAINMYIYFVVSPPPPPPPPPPQYFACWILGLTFSLCSFLFLFVCFFFF